MPTLFVIRGADQGCRFELTEPIEHLGRDPSSTIQIHDTEVSRHHAEIRRVENDYEISDLNSSNGAFVNGQRVSRHNLVSGDQLQVGRTLMLYTGPAEESQEDLADVVSIGPPSEPGDHSRIVRSVTQQEGSRIFDLQSELPQNSWLARARSNLQVMYRTALAVSHTLDIDQLLQRIMELIFEWVEADRGCIMLMDPAAKTLRPKVRRTRKGVPADERITISKTILDYVIERKEGVLTSDAREDERWDPGGSIVQMGVREAICVPMQGRYDVVGAIYIDTSTSAQQLIQRGGVNRFTEDHLKLMIAIGHQAALAVEDTRYYSAMVQAERLAAVGQTIATLSHHIKNILQGIRGGSYLIEMGLKDHDDEVTRKGWTIVERNQNRISALVLDMLTFSKEREPDLCTAELNEVVAEVIELTRVRAEETQVELIWRPGEPMPSLVFDPEGIHRAVLNVVANAVDAVGDREAPGRVEVASQYLPQEAIVRITVEDNGPGIPADQMEHLFSPFISSKKSRGTGLGLPVSKKILGEHDGRILVQSEPGKGCRFTLELPATLPQDDQNTTSFDTMEPEVS
ncbi:MAG: FHA domain-containing protein [Planctomycetes bacterium]|nr:FHA domain-containing protein [Planctomycetota bacterium]MCG2682160.1 ATP-binding protein [Planctomycetales bacterium]